ncbi:MAG: alpha/beta hydrolase, partial [Candidatus Eisenbacteria bacterium]
MQVKGGRLELLVPHMLRSQLLRPGFLRMSLQLGLTRQMPAWAKLQFTSHGVTPDQLNFVLGRVGSLVSWVDEWESLGRSLEQGGRDALALGKHDEAAARFLNASAAYNFSQYVVFLDPERKKQLHAACVRAYAQASPYFEVPAVPFEAPFRNRLIRGYLRVPPGDGPRPVVVLFNGTNAVKEELHWWSDSFLQRGIATITFDGPGLGETFHRLSYVGEPRPVGVAIMNHIESLPELDPDAVAYLGLSLGGYCAIRMAAHDPRVRAVAAVSPPFSADVYWDVTLSSMRRELAALYQMEEAEMGRHIHRITLEHTLPTFDRPLMLAGGGYDMITPGEESQRIFDAAHCERELVYYPRGAHECFNVLSDLRPRMVGWLSRQLAKHRLTTPQRPKRATPAPRDLAWLAGEAVDPDFADELRGESRPLHWHAPVERAAIAARFRWPWGLDRKLEV